MQPSPLSLNIYTLVISLSCVGSEGVAMSLAQPHHGENHQFTGDFRSSFIRNHPHTYGSASTAFPANKRHANNNHRRSYNNSHNFPNEYRQQYDTYSYVEPEALPSFKRRKFSSTNWESYGTSYNQPPTYGYSPSRSKMPFLPPVASVASDVDVSARTSTSYKRDRARFEEDGEVEFMSRDQIERLSPSRKDGIDALQETHLRYSYCAFLQNLGVRLELPQTTIGTAMVLCHRFFVRRSHASHDRFLIATATLFLAAKSEETPCPLSSVLRASSEIFHKQDFNVLCYLLPVHHCITGLV
ncbi:cyclin-T1-4-like protein isoform X1 [Tanacetum coccineum]